MHNSAFYGNDFGDLAALACMTKGKVGAAVVGHCFDLPTNMKSNFATPPCPVDELRISRFLIFLFILVKNIWLDNRGVASQ